VFAEGPAGDEPTTALDVTVDQVLKLLSALCDDLGTACLSTHDLAVVAQTCQRIGVMYSGRIVEKGSVSEVFTGPHHPYTLGLIESPDRPTRAAAAADPGNPPNPTDLPQAALRP
jgi:ABC-type dipeptide/oligopeptide/nickel transport system ATPase component